MNIPDFVLEDTARHYRQLDRDYAIGMYLEEAVDEYIESGCFHAEKDGYTWWVGFFEKGCCLASFDCVSDSREEAFDGCLRHAERHAEALALIRLREAGVR